MAAAQPMRCVCMLLYRSLDSTPSLKG